MAFTITNTGKDTLISDGTQNPSFNRNFISGMTKATSVENPLTSDIDTVLVVDAMKQAILMPYDDITDIGGSTPAALGLLNASQVASYLNNNYFSLAGGGGGSLPAGTADKNNLQWNNVLAQWVDNPKVKFGYQNSDLSGYVTGTYGAFDYGTPYAWIWKSYPNADGTPIDNHVIADNFIYVNAYNSRQRRNVELLNFPIPEVIGTNYPPLAASNNEWFAEVSDYNLSERTVSAPSIYARNSITPTAIVDEVNAGAGEITNVIQNKDSVKTTVPLYAFDHTIGFNGIDVVWSVEGSQAGVTFSGVLKSDELSMQILNNSGGLSCTGDLATLVPKNVGGLYLGNSSIAGSGFHILTYGSYAILQGIASNTTAFSNPATDNASVLLASGSTIDIDSDTTSQTINSVALGGKFQNLTCPNTAYVSGLSSRGYGLDFAGGGYTLNMANDPISLIVMDCTVQAETFTIPPAASKYNGIEITVKKIGANNLTISDGGSGTVEQIGGGWGNTYVIGGTNSAVTIKCIDISGSFYWIVF